MGRRKRTSFLGSIARGKLAGFVGTAAMDALWYSRYQAGGGEDGFADWELATGLKDWSAAPAPAQFGKKVAEAFTGRELPDDSVRLVTNVVHWSTGIAWGGLYGLSLWRRRGAGRGALPAGLAFGTAVWASSYVILPLAGVYKPIWEYDAETLWKDLSAHWVYGLTTASAARLLTRRGRRA